MSILTKILADTIPLEEPEEDEDDDLLDCGCCSCCGCDCFDVEEDPF